MRWSHLARAVRIRGDVTELVSAEEPPFVCPSANGIGFEAAILNDLHPGGVRVFNDGYIIYEGFPVIKKAEQKLVPEGGIVASRRLSPGGAVGDRLPGRAGGFIAGGPRFRAAPIGPGIDQFQGGSAAIRRFRPASTVEIGNLIDQGIASIAKAEAFPSIRQSALELAI